MGSTRKRLGRNGGGSFFGEAASRSLRCIRPRNGRDISIHGGGFVPSRGVGGVGGFASGDGVSVACRSAERKVLKVRRELVRIRRGGVDQGVDAGFDDHQRAVLVVLEIVDEFHQDGTGLVAAVAEPEGRFRPAPIDGVRLISIQAWAGRNEGIVVFDFRQKRREDGGRAESDLLARRPAHVAEEVRPHAEPNDELPPRKTVGGLNDERRIPTPDRRRGRRGEPSSRGRLDDEPALPVEPALLRSEWSLTTAFSA